MSRRGLPVLKLNIEMLPRRRQRSFQKAGHEAGNEGTQGFSHALRMLFEDENGPEVSQNTGETPLFRPELRSLCRALGLRARSKLLTKAIAGPETQQRTASKTDGASLVQVSWHRIGDRR